VRLERQRDGHDDPRADRESDQLRLPHR